LGLLWLALSLGCASGERTAAGTATFCHAIIGFVLVDVGATSSTSGLRFSIQSLPNLYPSVAFEAALPGISLEALTYDVTNDTAATTTVQETATGGVTWTQVSAAEAQVGTFSLALTDAGEATPIDGGTAWLSPQGNLTVTLVPEGTLTDAGIVLFVFFNPAAGAGCQLADGGPI
jgi:hypothetical protein